MLTCQQEVNELGDDSSPRLSRLPSPERPTRRSEQSIFPFSAQGTTTSMSALISELPDADETRVLVDSYFRYFAWQYVLCLLPVALAYSSFDIAPRNTIEKLIRETYAMKDAESPDFRAIDSQCLALLFIILAIGSLHNLELPPHDPSADKYLELSKRSLAKADFLIQGDIAGIRTMVSIYG